LCFFITGSCFFMYKLYAEGALFFVDFFPDPLLICLAIADTRKRCAERGRDSGGSVGSGSYKTPFFFLTWRALLGHRADR